MYAPFMSNHMCYVLSVLPCTVHLYSRVVMLMPMLLSLVLYLDANLDWMLYLDPGQNHYFTEPG